jgi:Pilus formation protein N terminal region
MRYYLRNIGILKSCLLALALSTDAQAAQEIVLVSDQSQIVKLPEIPTTVLVGNPAIADITIEGKSMFVHPKGYGLTNILALDQDGKKLGDYQVRVIYEDSYSVSMYGPEGRQTYTCRKDCEPTVRIGDVNEYFSTNIGQVIGQ